MREPNDKSSLPPIITFPKTPQCQMGSIEINNKFDEFKIRLKILDFKKEFIDKWNLYLIREELEKIENEFNEFLNKINSPTVINKPKIGEKL